jgi:2-polyprenyl-6-methoxyphenol hydroxylase-like FAD-dependent oxidoreductase
MEHRAENHAVASECFQYGQTIAVLPLTNHLSSIVITVTTDWAQKLTAMTEPTFTQWVTRKLNGQFETMRLVTDRFVYPLVAVLADRFAGIRTALIGDAAVGMHPVTAHGYNLGLSGQERLAQLIIDAHRREQDIGALNLLQQYAVHHRRVVLPLYLGTNSLVGLYTAEYRPTKILRKVLLHAANHCRPMRQVVIDRLVDQ